MSVVPFAEAVEPRLYELKCELTREAAWLLRQLERTHDPLARENARGRFLQALEDLALVVHAEPADLGLRE